MFSNEDDQELMLKIFTGPMLLMTALGGTWGWISVKGHQATAWLIEHQLLVPEQEATIPIMDAGLDTARVALLVAVAFLILWASISVFRRSRRHA